MLDDRVMRTVPAPSRKPSLRTVILPVFVMAALAAEQAWMGMPAGFIVLKVLAVPMLFLSERGLESCFAETRADWRGRVHPRREYVIGSAYLIAAFITILVIDPRMTLLTACGGFALVFVLFSAMGLFRHWRAYGRTPA